MVVMSVLAVVKFTPLLVALLVAWMLSVCVHEFCHALVAYWGGDITVKEKGYLDLNPARYVDPVSTLLIPAVILLVGGVPLFGGAVMIDEGLLRSRRWSIAVSAAGPVGNILLALLLSIPLHPWLGLVDPMVTVHPAWVYFLGAVVVLNLIAAIFNLLPVPPLDGYRMIEHQLGYETRMKLRQHSLLIFGALFVFLWQVPEAWMPFWITIITVFKVLGLPADVMFEGYDYVLFGVSP